MTSAPERLLSALRHARPVRAASPWAWTLRDAIRIRWAVRHGPDEFDRTHGVRTHVVPSVGEFARTFLRGGVEHEPIPSARFREALDGLDVDFTETVFVDYGSGAGRAVLLAATYPFKEVIGVELSRSLHAQAEANLEAFPSHLRRAGAVRLVCGDAMAFAPPSDPAVLYFYNPFGAGVMRTVLATIEASLARTPRPVTLILAFCYKAPREVVEGSAFFRLVSADGGIAILRSVTPVPAHSTA
jgi:SAM-dependent methyltransferase